MPTKNRKSVNDATLNIRLPKDSRKAFVIRAKQHGSISDVLRDLVVAFAENRVTVYPPVTSKEPIYVARK